MSDPAERMEAAWARFGTEAGKALVKMRDDLEALAPVVIEMHVQQREAAQHLCGSPGRFGAELSTRR